MKSTLPAILLDKNANESPPRPHPAVGVSAKVVVGILPNELSIADSYGTLNCSGSSLSPWHVRLLLPGVSAGA